MQSTSEEAEMWPRRGRDAAELPFVTVAMPCLDEAGYIEECLRTALGQDYPPDKLEILVVDGGSRDGTLAILERAAARDPRVRVIENPERVQAAAMNRAIRAARGDVIVRMDVHCVYAEDYVRACVRVLAATGAANAGGAQRPRARTPFQRAVCAALASPLAVGNARYRRAHAEGDVDTVFLGAFDRRIFARAGLFDPRAVTNEDAELNLRIRRAGGRVYLSREIEVYYYPRASLRALFRQYARYGIGRARTALKHGALPPIRSLAPAVVLASGAALVLAPPLWPLAPPAALAYAGLLGAEAIRVGRGLGAPGVLRSMAIFSTLHAAHGAGFFAGLWRYGRRPDWPAEDELLRDGATDREDAKGPAADHVEPTVAAE